MKINMIKNIEKAYLCREVGGWKVRGKSMCSVFGMLSRSAHGPFKWRCLVKSSGKGAKI